MQGWTRQTGYPVLTVTQRSDGKVQVSQERFLAAGGADAAAPAWQVPVRVKQFSSGEVTSILLLGDGQGEAQLEELLARAESKGEWVHLNAGHTGFYRVNYTPAQWRRLADHALPTSLLSAAEKIGLLGDCLALARSGRLAMPQYLAMATNPSFIAGPHAMAILEALVDDFSALCNLYSQSDFFTEFRELVVVTFEKLGKSLGWDPVPGEPVAASKLRPRVQKLLSTGGHLATINQALGLFDQWAAGQPLPADLKFCIFTIAARCRPETSWAALQARFRSSSLHEEKLQCLQAMAAASSDETLLSQTLDFALESGEVRLQDIAYAWSSLSSSPKGAELVWKTLTARWESLKERFGSTGFVWPSLVGLAAGTKPYSEAHCAEVESFFAERDAGSAARRVRQAIEALKSRTAQLKRDTAAVREYLSPLKAK